MNVNFKYNFKNVKPTIWDGLTKQDWAKIYSAPELKDHLDRVLGLSYCADADHIVVHSEHDWVIAFIYDQDDELIEAISEPVNPSDPLGTKNSKQNK
mgnify:CR=1 FL=1|jgi:hypothetical protein